MRVALSALAFIVLTVAIGALITLSALVAPSGRLMMPLGRLWSRALLGIAGVRVEVEGLEHARTGKPVLFMANHQSMLDIPAIAVAMPDSLRFVAKRSLAWVPFFGWAMAATGGCIFIDRKDRDQAFRGLLLAGERIRQGHSVLVFPEGTRSRTGALGELKKGPFHLAAAAKVPIVPIVVEGTRALMPRGLPGARPGVVRIRLGDPLSVRDDELPSAIAERVRAALVRLAARPPEPRKA